jgi:hypothetical protein
VRSEGKWKVYEGVESKAPPTSLRQTTSYCVKKLHSPAKNLILRQKTGKYFILHEPLRASLEGTGGLSIKSPRKVRTKCRPAAARRGTCANCKAGLGLAKVALRLAHARSCGGGLTCRPMPRDLCPWGAEVEPTSRKARHGSAGRARKRGLDSGLQGAAFHFVATQKGSHSARCLTSRPVAVEFSLLIFGG